jgi:DNA-binding IclR family transcriptional regulator
MIHFHNGGSSDYAGLQQLTGYSAGGLGKLLITLRKRGFIQRTGHGKYGLTENGKNSLAQALGG